MIFMFLNISVIVLRKKNQEWFKPTFKSPLFPLPQLIGIAGGLMLIPQFDALSLVFAGAVILVGLVWYKIYGAGKATPEYTILDILEDRPVPSIADAKKKKSTCTCF